VTSQYSDRLVVICGPQSSQSVVTSRHKVEAVITELYIKHRVVVTFVAN